MNRPFGAVVGVGIGCNAGVKKPFSTLSMHVTLPKLQHCSLLGKSKNNDEMIS